MNLRRYSLIVPLAWLAGPALAVGQLMVFSEQCGGGCMDHPWCGPAFWTACVTPGLAGTLAWLRALIVRRSSSVRTGGG